MPGRSNRAGGRDSGYRCLPALFGRVRCRTQPAKSCISPLRPKVSLSEVSLTPNDAPALPDVCYRRQRIYQSKARLWTNSCRPSTTNIAVARRQIDLDRQPPSHPSQELISSCRSLSVNEPSILILTISAWRGHRLSACRLSDPADEGDAPACLAFSSPTPSDFRLAPRDSFRLDKLCATALFPPIDQLARYAGTDVAIPIYAGERLYNN